MLAKKKICKGCKTEQFIWKSGFCKNCSIKTFKRKPIKKSYLSKQPTEKAIAKKEEKKEYTQKQWQFFLKIWNSRPHVSFESGLPIYGEPTSTMFHHCLEKGIEKYKKYALEDWNIVLLLPSEHNQVHTDISKTPKVKEYTEKLKEKYGK